MIGTHHRVASNTVFAFRFEWSPPPRIVSQETRFLRSRAPACHKIYGFCIPAMSGRRARRRRGSSARRLRRSGRRDRMWPTVGAAPPLRARLSRGGRSSPPRQPGSYTTFRDATRHVHRRAEKSCVIVLDAATASRLRCLHQEGVIVRASEAIRRCKIYGFCAPCCKIYGFCVPSQGNRACSATGFTVFAFFLEENLGQAEPETPTRRPPRS